MFHALFKLKYDTMLQAAHPIIATNVTKAVHELLLVLGHPEVAEEWSRL